MARRIIAFYLILMITLASVPAVYANQDSGNAKMPAYVVMSADTGQIVMEKSSTASTNISLLHRMMVCLLALENLDPVLTADLSGQTYTVPDLLKLSLLADNAAATAALSNLLTPVTDSLLVMMNRRAEEIGLASTLFTAAEESNAEYSHTTLRDVARFLSFASANPEFKALYCTQATVLTADGTLISNNNRLVLSAGGTRNVGGTLGSYSQEGKSYYAMSYMGNITAQGNDSTMSLILVADHIRGNNYELWGETVLANLKDSYYKIPVVTESQVLLTLPIGNESLNITASSTVYCITSAQAENPVSQISFTMNPGYDMTDMEPPVIAGTEIGTANILLYDGTTVAVPIRAGNSIYFQNEKINNFFTALISNRQILILICLLLGAELLLVIGKLKLRLGR